MVIFYKLLSRLNLKRNILDTKVFILISFTIKNKATHDIKQENMMMPTDSIRDFPYKQLGFLFLLHAI